MVTVSSMALRRSLLVPAPAAGTGFPQIPDHRTAKSRPLSSARAERVRGRRQDLRSIAARLTVNVGVGPTGSRGSR